MIVFFVYNILIFNYKDTKNYRDYQLFKRISYPELRYEGIIVLSGGVGSEVYSHVVSDDIAGLDATIKWYKQTFGVDYYLELQRCADFDLKSDTPSDLMLEQQKVNAVLMQKAKEYGVKVVATNDVHYVTPDDLAAYNIQQCYATGKTMDEFAKTDILQFRWLTSRKHMCELFSDVPDAIANTMDITLSKSLMLFATLGWLIKWLI